MFVVKRYNQEIVLTDDEAKQVYEDYQHMLDESFVREYIFEDIEATVFDDTPDLYDELVSAVAYRLRYESNIGESCDELEAYNAALDHTLMNTAIGKQFAHRKL